jgi:PAS domain S-box-containing protein
MARDTTSCDERTGGRWRATRLVLLVLALLSAGTAAQARAVLTEKPAVITVAVDDNYPPYIFRTVDGSLSGLLKDLWELWSVKTGIKVNLVATDWAKAQAMMAAGEADVIDTMFETGERKARYDFSAPYATIDVPIFFHKTISGISDAETLRGFTVGVKDGDACIDWLEAHGIQSLRRYPSYDGLITAAAAQDIRIFCLDQPPAAYLLYKRGLDREFRQTAPLYSGQFHWAVHKGDSLLFQALEGGFARINGTERAAIDAKWLGSSLTRQGAEYVSTVTFGLELAAAGAVVLGLWSWSLRRQVRRRTRELTVTHDALKRSESHYRKLVDLTPVGVFETDAQGNYLFVNERWCAITGLAADQALATGWMDSLHREDRQAVAALWQAAVAATRPFHLEFRLAGPGGRPIWVLGQASGRTDVDGEVTGYIGTITDITQGKEAKAELAESEARFRTIFDNINDAIFIHDMDSGAILWVNRRMLEMYGFDDDREIVGGFVENLSAGIPPYDLAAARVWCAKAMTEPQVFQWHARTRDGRLFWVEVSMRRALLDGGKERFLVVVRDISERKLAEQALEERSTELERSNADLEQFAYVASHDLREPLRMVGSYVALLDRRYGDKIDKDGKEFIAFAREGALRMDRLVHDLLEFSRVGRLADPLGPVELDLVLASVLKVLRRLTAEARAEVTVPTPLPQVTGAANELFLLFQNLISNAIKFRSPDRNPEITVSAERVGERWRIAVSDNGIGIEEAYFDRIFKIFQRLHTRDKYDGTGIGLSICKKVVEHHGGQIWVESELGRGTTFFFTLE